ncbi:hypothetical protein GLYMA_12G162972v4 [Glycine max]|nr:hypothetical protein GLYMA_12G162972v4 [Glycine max]KAH1095899.1 hypothetical protein GYH30_057250 [Glycine max]
MTYLRFVQSMPFVLLICHWMLNLALETEVTSNVLMHILRSFEPEKLIWTTNTRV